MIAGQLGQSAPADADDPVAGVATTPNIGRVLMELLVRSIPGKATGCLVAAAALLGCMAAQAQEAARDTPADRWVISTTLYAWGTSLDGDAKVAGRKADVDVPFSDILDDLSVAGMAVVTARKGPWGFYVSPFYAQVDSEAEAGGFKARIRNDTTFLGAGGLYRLLGWSRPEGGNGPAGAQLEALAGARLTDLRLEVNGRNGLPKDDESETWVDPLIGLAGRIELTDRWETFAEGSIGGFGVGSDLTWDWLAGAGYRVDWFGDATFLRAGYRMLHLDYEDGGFKGDVTYKGPFLGMTIRF